VEANVDDHHSGNYLEKLLGIMAQLRSPDGCPWDREQTHASLKPCLLEETYELLDAVDEGDPKKLREELGDLLLQVVFHSQIAAEAGQFTIKEVVTELSEKLVRRHPYVFAGGPVPEDTAAVLRQRLQIKAGEKRAGEAKSALGSVPKAMPALARAQAITRRAGHLGFDWPHIEPVWGKVEEEIAELKNAAASGAKERTEEELGDLLFSLVNLARFLDIEAEQALARTIDRFVRRFRYIETKLGESNRTLEQSSLEEMDLLWEEAKQLEARAKAPA
jgi:tetrapyrrole methylase family protein/MazG family protein